MTPNCAWCGSKGGFANPLIEYVVSNYGDVLNECLWCSINTTNHAIKEAS